MSNEKIMPHISKININNQYIELQLFGNYIIITKQL